MATYHSARFSLSQAAVDQISLIYDQYLAKFPEDPPVLAGIFSGLLLRQGEGVSKQLGVAFWRRSEVSAKDWAEEDIFDIAGFKVLFAVPDVDALMFQNGIIDYTTENAFLLRPVAKAASEPE